MVFHFVVNQDEVGCRLDRFLVQKIPTKSRTKIQESILADLVFLDKKLINDPSLKVKLNQNVEFIESETKTECELQPEHVDFRVIYEDNDILVVDKPAGVVVHPGNGNWSGTLVNGLLEYSKDLSSGSAYNRPGIVHRIDKDTSGILVVAKNDFAHMKLAEQFAIHSIIRRYICYTYGSPQINSSFVKKLRENNFQIETQIGRDNINRKKMKVLQCGGKKAITNFKILKKFCDLKGNVFASKVECELKTGRTHQVRVHMTKLGAPLIGDQVYGKRKKLPICDTDYVYKFPRQALHAFFLSFIHPVSGKKLEFQSALPSDMEELENKLFD